MPEFEAFAVARSGALYRTAWLLTGDRGLSEDLVQETLARIFLRWRSVARMDNPAAYARRVLINAHISHRRLRRNQEVPIAEPRSAGPGGSERSPLQPVGPSLAHTSDLRMTLLDGLAQLDRVDRAVLVLRYWEDLDATTTAGLLGLTAPNVRTRSMRALTRLRAVLGEDLLAH